MQDRNGFRPAPYPTGNRNIGLTTSVQASASWAGSVVNSRRPGPGPKRETRGSHAAAHAGTGGVGSNRKVPAFGDYDNRKADRTNVGHWATGLRDSPRGFGRSESRAAPSPQNSTRRTASDFGDTAPSG